MIYRDLTFQAFQFIIEMLIRSFDNRPRLTGFAVFADPGMQGIRIDTQLLGGLSDRLIGFNRQLDGGFPEFRWIDFWFFFTHFGHPFFCSFYFSLCVRFSVATSVWLWDGKEAKGHHWHLLVRWEIPALNEIKYSLSNASEEVSSLKLAQMQGQRYWVERSFQDGKSHAGLDHYQARGWKAWQHHMALVMMAMLFMLEERVEQQEDYPLLTCSDIYRWQIII